MRTKSVKVVAISDLHGHLPQIPKCDILLIAGDLGPPTNSYHNAGKFAIKWIMHSFNNWLKSIPAKHIVGIAGNHDFVANDFPHLMNSLHWNYLCDTNIKLMGLLIHGSPYTPSFHDWAFQHEDERLYLNWKHISIHTDILVTHSPPRNILDQNYQNHPCGSNSLRDRVSQIQPTLHVFGHIHEQNNQVATIGNTTYANVSYLDHRYQPTNKIQQFTIYPKKPLTNKTHENPTQTMQEHQSPLPVN